MGRDSRCWHAIGRRESLRWRVIAARLPPPTQPTPGIANRTNLALLVVVDHLNRHERDLLPRGNKRKKHFRFGFKVRGLQIERRPNLKLKQTETTLRVRQRLSSETGETAT